MKVSPRIIGLACVALASFAARRGWAQAPAPEPEVRWYAVLMGQNKVGWMREEAGPTADGHLRSASEMRMSVGRGEMSVEVVLESEFVETAEGMPVSMKTVQQLGAAPVATTYVFKGDTVEVTDRQGDREVVRAENIPAGEWMTPFRADRFVTDATNRGDNEIRYRMIDPFGGLQVLEVVRKRGRKQPVEALGKTVPGESWTVEQSMMPGVASTEWVDVEGHLVRGESVIGAITLTVVAADKETALTPSEPTELLASTLITPDKPIEDARHTRRAVYTLRVLDGELPDLPTQGAQRFERMDERTGRLTVDLDAVGAADRAEAQNGSYLEASSMLGRNDPEVMAIAGAAMSRWSRENAPDKGVLPPPGDAVRAEWIRREVNRTIEEKSLNVGLATASDVARTGEGDCTEHAVLLAAALRAAGIPSRVASGVIYVDEFVGRRSVFGFHMWTQALLDVDGAKRWVDLDATLPDTTPCDAAHIALAVTALEDGRVVNAMAALAPLMGRLEIIVEEVGALPTEGAR